MVNVKDVQLGRVTRKSFAKVDEILEIPDLIEVQKNSYQWFLDEGIREVFKDVGTITDPNGKMSLSFVDYTLGTTPKYTISECKERDATYAVPMHVKVRLKDEETGKFSETMVFMGDFPLMTESGNFVINGAERVIVSQLVRSPGVYFGFDYDKTGKKLFHSTVIPNRGAWLEFEMDSNDIIYVRIDKNRKIPATTLVRALGKGTDDDIYDLFGEDEVLRQTIEQKDSTKNMEEALLEVYKKLRPGEPPTVESAQNNLNALFFDARRYDLARFGRYKYNKKLGVSNRITGHKLAAPVINPMTGELIAEAGETVTMKRAAQIEQAGVMEVLLKVDNKEVKVVGNGMVDIAPYLPEGIDPLKYGINEKVSFSVLREILDSCNTADELNDALAANAERLVPKHIVLDDIFASVSYFVNLCSGVGDVDDIDHLGNRRVRSVGELLQNQLRIGFARMERVIRERMSLQSQERDETTPGKLINIRAVVASIKEFFGSSPLSQFMDQNNPLAELTHKRRLSALGPGGLSRDRASFEVRDVHYSHYGRMCPITTPEGPNIGLISYLASFAKINKYGFIEAPYRKVRKGEAIVTDEVEYMTADVEDMYIVAQANEPLDENGKFVRPRVSARHKDEIIEIEREKVDYMDVSMQMMVSVETAMIPFLENDNANRALMGANMQRQAVPLMITENPIVATGMEYKAAIDSGVCVIAKENGIVTRVTADEIIIHSEDGKDHKYRLIKFTRSNQGTCINQRPIVNKGDVIKKGDVIADGPATCNGEISLGKNALIGFMTWEGYNYEDAVLISEKLVYNDVYTSIHIVEFELECRGTKLGAEEITREIPNVSEDALKDLDERGIIRIGAEVHAGDILVGKVTPKGETDLTAEERLLKAIFGDKARDVRDNSLRVPHGESGIIVDVKVFDRTNCAELAPGVNTVVRCYIAQKRKISVGDKMAGRHGNKGVVSRILPVEDMPFLPDGTPLDIVLNPLGVPSRMNIGQVLEVHLGYAARALGWEVMTPVFNGAREDEIKECLKMAGFSEDAKTQLTDGRTGEKFDSPVTVGYMYYLKLHHLVDDKIHARSTGPYSLVTQQPLGGKAQFGGQRFGEMEVWALEAYGAAYTLQEILTVKSDDIVGRVKTYEAIVKGEEIPKPGVPESFKVLVKELQSLGLDVKVLDKNNEEIDLKQTFDDDDEVGMVNADDFEYVANEKDLDSSFIPEGPDEEDDVFDEDEDDEEFEDEFDDDDDYGEEDDFSGASDGEDDLDK